MQGRRILSPNDGSCVDFVTIQCVMASIISGHLLGNDSENSASNSGTPIDQIITQLNRGDYSWTTSGPITYSFATSLPAYAFGEDQYTGFRAFSEQQEVMARLALSTWSDVADITFEETVDGVGDISFANSSSLAYYSAAHAYLPGTSSVVRRRLGQQHRWLQHQSRSRELRLQGSGPRTRPLDWAAASR